MTCIDIKTGSEGPRHDPYGYEEITVTRPNGDVVTLHEGLTVWLKLNNSAQYMFTSSTYEDAVKKFEFFAGCSPAIARRAYERMQYRCKCGSRDLRSVAGFPGESLNVCNACNTVVSSDFNESAII